MVPDRAVSWCFERLFRRYIDTLSGALLWYTFTGVSGAGQTGFFPRN
jgi:hypothetical protein